MRVLPSQAVQAIDSLIGAKNTDIDDRRIGHHLIGKVSSILALIDRVPDDLINLPFGEFVELLQCREVLSAATRRWVLGDTMPAHSVNGKDPIERIRRLLSQCQDNLPPPEPELPFVFDVELREGFRLRSLRHGMDIKRETGLPRQRLREPLWNPCCFGH